MRDDAFRAVVHYLCETRGLRIQGIRTAVLERRCRERAERAGCGTLFDYLKILEGSPEEVNALLNTLVVGYTRFFRDPLTDVFLDQRVVPEMIRTKVELGQDVFRVWSAGCATGEEAYGLALILCDAASKVSGTLRIHILGTDRDAAALEAARTGRYDRGRLEELPLRLVDRFFRGAGGFFQVVPEVGSLVRFVVHDLLQDEPPVPVEAVFKDFDLISCRNVLMYYDRPAQEKILRRLHQSLEMGGVLVLGAVEGVPPGWNEAFHRLDWWCAVHRKVA